MPLKVTINDSFTVIVNCSTTTPISNIVIFGIVVTVGNNMFQDDLERGQIFIKEPYLDNFIVERNTTAGSMQ